MSFSPEPRIEKSLRHSLKDGAAYAVMTGSGENYFSAFAVFLRAGAAQIGFLASVPPLVASFTQLFSAYLGHKTGQRKRIILAGALTQALLWLPMGLLPLAFPDQAVAIFIAMVILYHASGNLALPQWSSLIGELVDQSERGRFFASRTRISASTSFIALVIAGFTLFGFARAGMVRAGFLTIFGVALTARLISVHHLGRMHDPSGNVAALEMPPARNFFRQIREASFIRFSLFFALMQFSVNVASPFFSLYILRDLKFSYLQFMSCSAATVLVQFLTLTRWGRISDIFGNRIILVVCGLLIPFLPLLWMISPSFYYLLFTQSYSGFIWAGFSLSATNHLYDLIPNNKRATYMAVHGVLAAAGVFSGAIFGGYLGPRLPGYFQIGEWEIRWLSSLYNVFLISFFLRLFCVAAFLPRLRELRQVRSLPLRRLVFRVVRFNPLTGLFFDVVTSRRRAGSEKTDG